MSSGRSRFAEERPFDISGASAVEFALVFPVLLLLMMGGIQLVLYINATRKVERIAASAAQMISSTAPPQGSSTATSTPADIHFAYDSALVLFPYVMTDAPSRNLAWWQDIEINFASVQFTQVASTCTNQSDLSACYLAQVAWTSSLGAHHRPCATPLVPTASTGATGSTMLPSAIFGPGSLIVIDVYFTFHPTFGSAFIAPITIERSVYMKPRYANSIAMDFSSNDGSVIQCPNF